MGSSASKNTEDEEDGSNGGGGGQLYVSLKMENSKVEGELTPHVYGSVPLVGSWDPSNAVSIDSFCVIPSLCISTWNLIASIFFFSLTASDAT